MFAAMTHAQKSARQGSTLKLHPGETFGEVSIVLKGSSNGENPPVPSNGTVVAINDLRLGVAAHLPCSTGRGGARNHARRESHELSKAQVTNLIAAAGRADAIGLPFNRMITIHWQSAGVPLERMVRATGRFIDLLSKFLARQGNKSAWLWVHENGPGKGAHCHLLAHVPASLVQRLTALQKGWLRRITGQPYRSRVILSKPIGGRLGLEVSNPELHAANKHVALAYLLKGASPAAAATFNLELPEPGGRIIGKRCGTSQNIGAKARKKG